ncbi:UGMP family protein [archaeon]|nr:UGMP family protein [archaeon]|tara:strand:+ start:144 stop:1130 length:987 start_codon:yes stop_codon:yes gene_type:complete
MQDKDFITVGIEASAHTYAVGIIKGKTILANQRASYTTEVGGIIPMQAALHHEKHADEVIANALKEANISIKDIDLVSYTRGPGMGPCLRVGLATAKKLAEKTKTKQIVGINHCVAHLSVGQLTNNTKDPVILYSSGANTQVIAYEGKRYRIMGETLDMGCGNFLDSFARDLGLGFPGGPKIAELAHKGKKYVELPYSVKGMDVSFSGLFTNLKQKIQKKEFKKEDLAFSTQETAFAMLVEVAERALAHTNKQELFLAGGVCCNDRLQEMCNIMCKERGAVCHIPSRSVLVDNGVMIAWQGYLERKRKTTVPELRPYERTDQVNVDWV